MCPGMGEAINALEVGRKALPPATVDDIVDQMAFLLTPKKGKGRKSSPTTTGISFVRRFFAAAFNSALNRSQVNLQNKFASSRADVQTGGTWQARWDIGEGEIVGNEIIDLT